jgi:bifunctional non-homologous end joining protein LigD
MLATLVPRPFHKPNWVYEEKYDGIRILAYKEGNKLSLITRNDTDRVGDFPNLAAAIRHLNYSTLLLDGEVVVFDQENVSRFQLLQQRSGEAKYAVFDCLFANGRDLRAEPLSVRRKSLRNAIETGNVLLVAERLAENGLEAYRLAKRRGFEGVVAKDVSSPYVEGRSRYWLKVKIRKEEEFIIGGYTAPVGSRKYFGALLLGAYKNGVVRYVGKVGTGFNEKTLSSLFRKFKLLVRKALRANIHETPVVLLINEQGEKEKERDEREFSWCSFFGGFGWRGTERRRAKRAAAQWSGSQSGCRFDAGFAAGFRSGCQSEAAELHSGVQTTDPARGGSRCSDARWPWRLSTPRRSVLVSADLLAARAGHWNPRGSDSTETRAEIQAQPARGRKSEASSSECTLE